MTISKDASIITQVAAKIAADLVTTRPSSDLEELLSDFSTAFAYVSNSLFDAHNESSTNAAVAAVMAAMPGSTLVIDAPAPRAEITSSTVVRIAGKSHGPLPDWLIKDAAAAGVAEVWDNRDKLAENPKRPHFKAVNGDKAFWPPKAR